MTGNILKISTNFNEKNNYKNVKYNKNKNNRQNYKNNIFTYINNFYYKKQIINYIYDTIDISKYTYSLISNNDNYSSLHGLDILDKEKHYLQLNYSGINCYLIFIKINDKYFSALVEKKTLNYNKNKLNINNVRIREFDVKPRYNIYNGTILDGSLIFDKKNKDINFIINDVLYLAGEKQINYELKYKFNKLNAYLEINPILSNDDSNNFSKVILNKNYEIGYIKNLIKNLKSNKIDIFPSLVKGLSFVKDISGDKIIYIFDSNKNNNNKSNNHKNNNNYNNSHNTSYKEDKSYRNKKQIISPKEKIKEIRLTNSKSITAIFEMKRKDTGVYELYLIKKWKDPITNKLKGKRKKKGIAYIPTVECSNFCEYLYSSNLEEDKSYIVECKYYPENGKWVPFKLRDDLKKPDSLKKVEKKLIYDL